MFRLPTLSRRGMLLGLGAVGLAACSPDPTIQRPATNTSPAAPGEERTVTLLGELTGALRGRGDPWAKPLAAMTTEQLTVTERLVGATTTPSPSPADLETLASQLAEAAGRCCVASEGLELRLVMASVAITTRAHASDFSRGPAPEPGVSIPFNVAGRESREAWDALVDRQRRLIFILERIVGSLSWSDEVAHDARLTAAIRELDAIRDAYPGEVPAPPLSYEADLDDSDLEAKAHLDVTAAWAQVASIDSVAEALDSATEHAVTARSLGHALNYWPAWV